MTDALYSTIASFLDDASIPYVGEADALIVTEISGDHGSWRTFIQITDEPENRFVVIHAQFPAGIPLGSRAKLSERLTRINYDLTLGNFEVGMDDGELLFKTAIDLADGVLTRQMFWRMYDRNRQVMNQHFAEIAELALGASWANHFSAIEIPGGVTVQ